MIEHPFDENHSDILGSIVKPEVKEFLETSIRMLPKLTEMMQITSAMYDLTQSLLKDTEMTDILEKSMFGDIEPIQDRLEHGVVLANAAQKRAKCDTSKVGMIGMYKMFKDPTVQRNLKFMKALLSLINERREENIRRKYIQ
ncbi:DUF1641 domain-containing protein [Alicyclobacillus fastidiosus]|uniref:DUF1641 domain-containing protein n=1 Tax=Alicyclobacillus fastidiosus TaxID=392011 RepID=A0ABY6ZJ98_9BACL|nr:DUF1641 domain-containing protein [Alicyclobacillus fastidiosus]WAH42850.1 DUF1641 domain-containing protein [Alicyclobacillus fastidiosus]GMA64785.1 hypothetical protein GCM10025859_52250 [Alicyclobacillus fastidiosus]